MARSEQTVVSDVEAQVGTGRTYGTLTAALGALPTIAAQAAIGDRIVLVLRDAAEQHPPGPISLPPGIDKLLIRGRGRPSSDADAALTAGVLHTTVILPAGHGDIRPLSGADLEYQDIRFLVGGAQPRSLFLQDTGGSTLRFRNCVASGPSAPAVDQVFARLRGQGDRLIADGLRIGRGFTHGIDARIDPSLLASSPLVDLRRCGFRALTIGVRLDNVSHARVRESVFAECGVGLWAAYAPGAPPGGIVHVADNRFSDCGIGTLLRDRSARAGVLGPAPADVRRLEPDTSTFTTTPLARRQVRLLRNEFRAPDAWAFPSAPSAGDLGGGVRHGEVIGVRAEFDPHPASQTSPWPPQLLVQANVFHLLDHGIGLRVGQHGQAVVDRCTFVANSVRSVFATEVATSRTRELGLVVSRSIFQSLSERPWLGTLEGAEPPDWTGPNPPDPRYRFGGVELWGHFGDVVMRSRMWVASNLFADFGSTHPRVYSVASAFGGEATLGIGSWEGAVTNGPQGMTTWGNATWDNTSQCVLLRLPKVRSVQGGALTMVEFDYHAVLGTAAAPFAGSVPGQSLFDTLHEGGCNWDGTTLSLDINGVSVDVPSWEPNSGAAWGSSWDERFVDYWLELVERYVALLIEADSNNRIAAWVMGDENLPASFVVETMARFRDLVEKEDPLRRPVLTGVQSNDAAPHWGGLPTVVGGAPLHWNEGLALPQRSWAPPSWSSQRGATLFIGREPRNYRGSELDGVNLNNNSAVGRIAGARQCLVGTIGSATIDTNPACKYDFGVILATPLDEAGMPRFTTHHMQSSWHFNRSVTDNPYTAGALAFWHDTNRSYAHHHGLVLRDTLELGRVLADRSMTRTRQDGHTFFNAPVLQGGIAPEAPDTLPPYRHDFWAGVHHAGGIYAYVLNQYSPPNSQPADPRALLLSQAFDEGMELIKATNPDGEGLREALANGQRWQTMRVGDDGPPWLEGWTQSTEQSGNIDFGRGAGRTFGEFGPGYYDLTTTAVRLGGITWLVVTNSVNQTRSITFVDNGKVKNLTPLSTGRVFSLSGDRTRVRFDGIDAVVVRIAGLAP